VPHQAKQDTAVRVLRCSQDAGAAVSADSATSGRMRGGGGGGGGGGSGSGGGQCTLQSMSRIAAEAVAAVARAYGVRAKRKKRRYGTLEGLPEARGNQSRPRLSGAVAAILAGECTQEERRLCADALRRAVRASSGAAAAGGARGSEGGGNSLAAPVEAELCLLRAADSPLGAF